MFVINTVFISNLYADVSAFSRYYSIFFREPLNVLVRTPGGTHTPGWKSVAYSKASSPNSAI